MTRQELKDLTWLKAARELSKLGTCARRQVACIFLDEKGHVLSTGYNGVAPGQPHCTDCPCAGAGYPSGQGLEFCEAIHAEQNALTQCKFPDKVHTVYCTDSPCMHCVKMLATTSAQRVVFDRTYPHTASKDYWEGLGRSWEHVPLPIPTPWSKGAQKPITASSGTFLSLKDIFKKLTNWYTER